MLLKELTEISGVSGNESMIRSYIKEKITSHVEKVSTDPLGNLIAFKPAKSSKTSLKVMICAHMDEVGLMILGADSNGLLRFAPVGGIDARVLPAKNIVIGDNKVKGVIGSKPIHLQEAEERTKPYNLSSMYIDIGASGKEEALEKVKIGDYASFDTEYEVFGEDCAKGKAFDDRVGCSLLIDILQEDRNYDFDLFGVFSTQEELGTRGAGVAAYSIEPDIALVLECTAACDLPDVDEHMKSTYLGKGPVVVMMDKSVVADRSFIDRMIKVAKENEIPYQHKSVVAGGTDAGKIRLTRGGTPSCVIALACRYLHSPVSLISIKDYNNTLALVKAVLADINRGGI